MGSSTCPRMSNPGAWLSSASPNCNSSMQCIRSPNCFLRLWNERLVSDQHELDKIGCRLQHKLSKYGCPNSSVRHLIYGGQVLDPRDQQIPIASKTMWTESLSGNSMRLPLQPGPVQHSELPNQGYQIPTFGTQPELRVWKRNAWSGAVISASQLWWLAEVFSRNLQRYQVLITCLHKPNVVANRVVQQSWAAFFMIYRSTQYMTSTTFKIHTYWHDTFYNLPRIPHCSAVQLSLLQGLIFFVQCPHEPAKVKE